MGGDKGVNIPQRVEFGLLELVFGGPWAYMRGVSVFHDLLQGVRASSQPLRPQWPTAWGCRRTPRCSSRNSAATGWTSLGCGLLVALPRRGASRASSSPTMTGAPQSRPGPRSSTWGAPFSVPSTRAGAAPPSLRGTVIAAATATSARSAGPGNGCLTTPYASAAWGGAAGIGTD